MKAYAITDIGKKRSFNQDYAWMTTDEIGKLPNLFIVADGMGGHRGGGYASRLAVETILEQIRQSQAESPAEILVDAIRQDVYKRQESHLAFWKRSCYNQCVSH